jgi:hypothetical protein
MKRALVVLACVAVGLAGCSKSEPSAADAATSNIDAGTGPTAKTDASAEAGAGATTAASTFTGKYTVTAGTMYVPSEKDWASVKFKNDDTKMLGDGEMTLTVDPSGRVSGATESGPLGASVLEGHVEKGILTGTIRRKDTADQGLTGTLLATVAGDGISGTMNLAESNAAVVRIAKLEAKKK